MTNQSENSLLLGMLKPSQQNYERLLSYLVKKTCKGILSSKLFIQVKKKILFDLPDDLLIAIFSFCDIKSLGRFAQTCKKFCKLIKYNSSWKRNYNSLTCIHHSCHPKEIDKKSRMRSHYTLREFCRLALNWKSGKGKAVALKYYERQLPWMQLDPGNYLWISDANKINAYKLNASCNIYDRPHVTLKCDVHDVNRFIFKRNTLVAGYRDGSAACFNKSTKQVEVHLKKIHAKEIQTVDIMDDSFIITGSFDYTVKIFNKHSGQKEVVTLPLGDRVLSLVSFGHCKLAVGTAGVKHFRSPITIWDMQRAIQISYVGRNFKHGAGILDMKELDANILLTSDYDSYVKVWDLRIPTSLSVLSFEDPSDSAIYCMALDYRHSVISGSARSSQSVLWDLRSPNRPVQIYHFRSSSPVYSLAFSPTSLFMALDECLAKIDFYK